MKDNIFLVLADVGEKIEETFGVKSGMRQFIAWLGNLTAELKKPADEQTGAAREITRTIEDVVYFVGLLRAGLLELKDAIKATGLDEWAKDFGYVRLAVIGLTGFLSLGFLSAVVGLFSPLATLAISMGRVVWISGSWLVVAHPLAAAILAIAGAAALLYIHLDKVKSTLAELMEMFEKLPDWIVDPFGVGGSGSGRALPEWMTNMFGVDVEPTGEHVGASRRPQEGLVGPPAADATSVRVGGEVRVRFDGLPRGATVDVKSDNPAVPLDVQSGYILAPG